ncbi:MAG: sugar phosphate nucleotidyltransferase [Bacteroidales bacterium]|nr:sugar phosphate nucleotidyltransferase [Bacteroidales bacterium]
MKTTLLIMAAGLGSRYGGLKQLDTMGPGGETIMDYSIYDALQSGFNKIVFVIRKSFEDEFSAVFAEKFRNKVEVELVCQEIDEVPAGAIYNEAREKPWGTGHAIWVARNCIQEPFAVINADDFYSKEAFETMEDFLKSKKTAEKDYYSMCAYKLQNTLSENGSVSRGLCKTDTENFLETVTEHTNIQRNTDGIIYSSFADGSKIELNPNSNVSMNFWGFTPGIFRHIEQQFVLFLKNHGQELKSEFYIPSVIDELILNGIATTEVLECNTKWFGVTYAEDKLEASKNIQQLIENKVYPSKLWK